MACNCCRTSVACTCKIFNGPDDPDTTPNPNPSTSYGFGYGFDPYNYLPWVHKRFPETYAEATWDKKNQTYVGSNARYSSNGTLLFAGNISTASRRGRTAFKVRGISSGYAVEDYNGDTSSWQGVPGASTPTYPMTIFDLEVKDDNVKRECQLWVKFRKATLRQDASMRYYWDLTDWSELVFLHSNKWSNPLGAMLIVTIPSTYFVGVESGGVELRFYCTDVCGYDRNKNDAYKATWTCAGQADWVTDPVITFPRDYCKSHGSFDGNVYFNYKGCSIASFSVNNKSEKIHANTYISCGLQFGFSVAFTGMAGYECRTPIGPCQPGFGNNNVFTCCGNIYGGYSTQPDGTIRCGPVTQVIPLSNFTVDTSNIDFLNDGTIIYNGVWANNRTSYNYSYNCGTYQASIDPTQDYVIGTVTVTPN
jgi:hypothetical protein